VVIPDSPGGIILMGALQAGCDYSRIRKRKSKGTYGVEFCQLLGSTSSNIEVSNDNIEIRRIFKTYIRIGDTVELDEIREKRFEVGQNCRKVLVNIFAVENEDDLDVEMFMTNNMSRAGEITIDIDNEVSTLINHQGTYYIDILMKIMKTHMEIRVKDFGGEDKTFSIGFSSSYY